MQQRRTLSLKAPAAADRIALPDDPAGVLRDAVARRTCVSAVYNRQTVILAPRNLFEKHGDLFLDAVVLERDGAPPRELRLGTYKLAGLTELAAVPRSAISPEILAAPRRVKAVTEG